MTKTNTLSFFILCCFFSFFLLNPVFGKVQIELQKNDIFIQTNITGVGGIYGCEEASREEVTPYIFLLYRKEPIDGLCNPEDCPCNSNCRWKKINKVYSEKSSITVTDMPLGYYKAEVLIGQAEGCDISTNTQQEKTIVFHKDRSDKFMFFPENNDADNKAISVSTFNGLRVFPNPTSSTITIHLQDQQLENTAHLVLYDLVGREVIHQKHLVTKNPSMHTWTLNLSALPEGAYLLNIFDNNGKSYKEKIIVQND